MRIIEILLWNNDPAKGNRSDPQPDLPATSYSDDLTNLANAFTRRGLVKHFWNLHGSERQPTEPPPPNAEPALIPSGISEPTTASWEAEPVEAEPSVDQHQLVPSSALPKRIRRPTWPT
jgi:hypothetical protein